MTRRSSSVLRSLLIGLAFGFVLVRSEAVSWYRIQEMVRFQAFHMYGIRGSAVLVGFVSLRLITRFGATGPGGEPVTVEPKETDGLNTRYWAGGTLFGLGWGILGACPGPIYTLIGAGEYTFLVALLAALAGTWAYGALRPRLPPLLMSHPEAIA